MKNAYDKELSYSYAYESSIKNNPMCSGYQSTSTVAVYPNTITYPNGHYRVEFTRASRTDYDLTWDYPYSYVQFKRSLLDEIKVWNDSSLVRKYKLIYGTTSIFPGVTWSAGGKTPSLTSITEFGTDGITPLPITNFAYDSMHLTAASNGYGGSMTFAYESDPWYEIDSNDDPFAYTYDSWQTGGTDHFAGDYVQIVRPGLYYKITLKTHPEYSTITLGINDGANRIPAQQIGRTVDGGIQTVSAVVRLPANDAQMRFFYRCDGVANCIPYEYKAYPVATRYRVTTRTEIDAVMNKSTIYTYRYDGPATNDAAHSAVVAATVKERRYTPAFSEYRGQAQVQEVSPDGRVSTTFFYQDDGRSGQASASLATTQSFWDPFDTLSSGAWTTPHGTVERLEGDKALKNANAGANWNEYVYRTANTINSGDMVMFQFRLSGTDTKAILDVENPVNPNIRWGIYITGAVVWVEYNRGSGWNYPQTLLTNFQRDRWYVALMVLDNNAPLTRIWERDDPNVMGQYRCDGCGSWSITNWRFKETTYNGTVWLDEYSEGRLYSLNDTVSTVTDPTAQSINLGSVTFTDSFSGSLCPSAWYCSNPGTSQTIEAVDGNPALKNVGQNGTADFHRAGFSIQDTGGNSNAVSVRFRTYSLGFAGSATLGLETQLVSGYWASWQASVEGTTSGTTVLKAGYSLDGVSWTKVQLLSILQPNTWYNLLLVVDDGAGFILRVWQADTPSVGGYYEYRLPVPAGASWRFYQRTTNVDPGHPSVVWLDDYTEGRLSSATQAGLHAYQPLAGLPVNKKDQKYYTDLKITWTATTQEEALSFENGSLFQGRRTVSQYSAYYQGGIQYGNPTRTFESALGWDAIQRLPGDLDGVLPEGHPGSAGLHRRALGEPGQIPGRPAGVHQPA